MSRSATELTGRLGEFHVGGLVARRRCLPATESGRPVARFDDMVDQSGHVVLWDTVSGG